MMRKAKAPRKREPLTQDMVDVALRQVSDHKGGALGWIVEFAREDPSRWLPSDAESNRACLMAFASSLMPPRTSRISVELPPDDVRAFQTELLAFLRRLVSGPRFEPIEIPAGRLRTTLHRLSDPGAKPSTFRFGREGSFRAMFYQALAEFVVTNDRLLACRYCGEPFLALRKSVFCSGDCTLAWWNRKKVDDKRKGGPRDAR